MKNKRMAVILAAMLVLAVPMALATTELLSDNASAADVDLSSNDELQDLFDMDEGLGDIEITTTIIFGFCILAAIAIVAGVYYFRTG